MNRRARSPRSFLPLALGIGVLLGGIAGEHGTSGLIKARAESRQLAAEVAALKAENAGLRERVDQLRHDPSAIEQVARHEFGLARRDEVVVVVSAAAASTNP